MMKDYLPLCFFIITCLCNCTDQKSGTVSSPKISFVKVEPGIELELLDWGGKGEPVLFLAGLGNSAHIFDDFAPQFNDHNKVFALSRRGFGASDKPTSGYDINRLTKDILIVIDSLKIQRVTLIGHSIAGDELTRFAASYPTRIAKLIYLDAAYDHSDQSLLSMVPPSPPLTKADSASVESVQNYLKRVSGVLIGKSELKAGGVFDNNGRFIRDLTPDFVYPAILKGILPPTYKTIQAQALAIYAIADSPTLMVPYYKELDTSMRTAAAKFCVLWKQKQQEQIDLFKKEMPAKQVIELHQANHYVFISNPKEVTKEIRKFLEYN